MNIQGTIGGDNLNGSQDDDILYAYEGVDVILGGTGNDILYGNQGVDSIDGEGGNDILFGGQSGDQAFGNQGNDILYGNQGDDLLFGDGELVFPGAAYVGNDTLYGGEGRDLLDGGAGDDVLYGNQASDLLYGKEGNDVIYGGQAYDILIGGRGIDTLIGGEGGDGFGFSPLSLVDPYTNQDLLGEAINSGTETDKIMDFNANEDFIVFARLDTVHPKYLGALTGSADDISGVVNAATSVQSSDQIALIEITSGALSGHRYLVYNVQGTEGAVELVGLTGIVTAHNFRSPENFESLA